jgi:hypothetical protein
VFRPRDVSRGHLYLFLTCFGFEAPYREHFYLFFNAFWPRDPFSRTFLLIFQRILASRPFLADISTYFSTHFGFEILSRGHFSLFSSMFRPRQPFSWIVHAIFQHVLSQRSFLTDSSPYFPPCFGLDNPSQFDLLFSALCLRDAFPWTVLPTSTKFCPRDPLFCLLDNFHRILSLNASLLFPTFSLNVSLLFFS